MNDLREVVRAAIVRVAPDVDPADLGDDTPFRDDAGLDSMDFLGVLTRLGATTGVEVSEQDYPSVTTIAALAAYIQAHLDAAPD